jgi:hypothetical protein
MIPLDFINPSTRACLQPCTDMRRRAQLGADLIEVIYECLGVSRLMTYVKMLTRNSCELATI